MPTSPKTLARLAPAQLVTEANVEEMFTTDTMKILYVRSYRRLVALMVSQHKLRNGADLLSTEVLLKVASDPPAPNEDEGWSAADRDRIIALGKMLQQRLSA